MRQHRVNRQRPAPIPQVRGRHAGEQRFFLMAIAMAFEPTAEFGVEWFHRLDDHLKSQGLVGAIATDQAFVVASGRPLRRAEPAAVLGWIQAQPEVLRARIVMAPPVKAASSAMSAYPARLARRSGGASQ